MDQSAVIQGISKKALMIILDGFGLSANTHKNAIRDAKKPHIDRLFDEFPLTTIEAGGELVGLPKGVAGNSEVGHMNLGAGKSVRQDLVRINEAIRDDRLKDMPKLQELIQTALKGSKRIHLMGLLSDGGVHSHIDHLKKLAAIFKTYPELKVYLHAFMDGRDTARDSGTRYVESILQDFPGGRFTFASMQGRSIGMDRDRRWPKIELAYKTMIGMGAVTNEPPLAYLKGEYQKQIFDEFITPVLFDREGAIHSEDSVFFFNFRPDRAGQMTLAMTWPKFTEFPRPVIPSYFLCMTPYVPDEVELPILFDKEKLVGGLSEYLSKLGKKQFKIAETEKYAHVTYFFNGGEKHPFPQEQHILIPSPKEVPTYDQKPEMSAYLVADRLCQAIESDEADFYLVNFANSDMVGHTGNYPAAVKAIEALDVCVGRLAEACAHRGVAMLITADHGNSDQMVYDDESPHTSHTGAPVPVCLVHPKLKGVKLSPTTDKGALRDVAPTILKMMGITVPPAFEGHSLF